MMRFIGKLDFAPQDPLNPEEWELEEDFGFLRDDGLLIIAISGGHSDGATIPWFLQLFLGHPFKGLNGFWAVIHDSGYRRYAIVIDTRLTITDPEDLFATWRELPERLFVKSATLNRKWWDGTMRMCMATMNEPRWKQRAVYRGVRLSGWVSWRKNHRKREVETPRTVENRLVQGLLEDVTDAVFHDDW